MLLSVIIPAFDCPEMLGRCLDALAASTRMTDAGDPSLLENLEVIVVDDGSTRDLASVLSRHAASDPAECRRGTLPVSLHRLEQRGGPARARNHGVRLAKGDVLVFLDADVCVHSDTLERFRQAFASDAEVAAVFGSYDDRPAEPGLVSQYRNLLHHFVHQRSHTDAWTFWAGCGAVRRRVYEALGGFNEGYARPCIEDIELGARMRQAGLRIRLDPRIQCTHLKRWTLSSVIRTDLHDRAIPWLELMRRTRHAPRDLNVTGSQRISVALVWILLACLAASVVAVLRGPAACAGFAAAVGLLFLNRDLYRFFAAKRGALFLVGAVALHWLYYFYCGLAVLLVLGADLRRALSGRDRALTQPPQGSGAS